DVGTLYTTVNWAKAFAPYAGLSMGDISIDERFGFNFAVGAYMLSQPRVDMEIVIDAAKYFRDRSDVHFVICGSGGAQSRLESLAAQAGLRHVRFFPLQ